MDALTICIFVQVVVSKEDRLKFDPPYLDAYIVARDTERLSYVVAVPRHDTILLIDHLIFRTDLYPDRESDFPIAPDSWTHACKEVADRFGQESLGHSHVGDALKQTSFRTAVSVCSLCQIDDDVHQQFSLPDR